MEPRDVVRVILAFAELYTKRKTYTLLFKDYETFSQLFQALPLEVVTAKTLLPLVRAYRRMDVMHEPFIRAACERVVTGEVELEPGHLAELIRLHSHLKIKNPGLFEHMAEVMDLRFPYFSEDDLGDIARALCALRYHSTLFFDVLRRELPYRLHEYAWWNLIDIAELYLVLQVDDREIITRIGNETFKLVYSMRSVYAAKALRVLAMLEAGDKRTFRLLIRTLPKCIRLLSPQVAAQTVVACAMVKVDPREIYHRLPGGRLYMRLLIQTMQGLGALSAKMICDVLASQASAGHRQAEFFNAIEAAVQQRPYKFHVEHLVSLLRDFAALHHKSPGLRALLLQRARELPECTPSALCALPAVLANHPHAGLGDQALLEEVASLLCAPGVYKLPADPGAFRTKDDFWWQQLRQRHFRLRRRRAAAGSAVDPGPLTPAATSHASSAAVAHISREECLQLIAGCVQLDWCDEPLLEGIATWLCSGRRHAELQPEDVSQLLGAFSSLGFTRPLLRAALEHALLRVAPQLPASHCTRALRGALDVGIGARSASVRALVRRCTAQLAMVPQEDVQELKDLGNAVRNAAESEVLTSVDFAGAPLARLPIEMHLFSEAVASRFAKTGALRIL